MAERHGSGKSEKVAALGSVIMVTLRWEPTARQVGREVAIVQVTRRWLPF
jgi:hypothetical protein